ncbi:MAG TPA: copper amine oxidase N-terminal domain-containing protein, partial [bacterium]|nr:copper amine oxidase N-terminal domain-containing protein [bacterium]
ADTYLVNEGELDIGQKITSFIDARKPVILIYPPQYQAEALIIGEFEGNVKADLFDENFVSSDKMLKLNLAEDTELIWKDGSVFEGTLANKKLLVIYGLATKSIPAQTSPMKVVVLSPSSKSDPGGENKAIIDYATLEIVVDKEKIEAPAPYANEKGVVMVPLRPIVEALGLSVDWDGEKRSIAIGENISLTIGRDNYKGPWTASAQLGAAPKLVESRTYVPLAFFTELVGLNKAYVFENQIIISSGS